MSFTDVKLASLETLKADNNGRPYIRPFLALGYENDNVNALTISDYHARSFVDIGRQLEEKEGDQQVYEWGRGIADSFKAAYDSSDLDFQATGIYMEDAESLGGRIRTDLGEFETDYGTAALAGVLTEADFKVEEAVIENVGSPKDYGIERFTSVIPVNDIDYIPQTANEDSAESQEWTFEGRVKGNIELPRSKPREKYNGELYTTGESIYANIIQDNSGRNRALLFDPAKLTEYSWRQFEFDSNQNTHSLDKPQSPKHLRAPKVEDHLLEMSNTEAEFSASAEEVGWANVSEVLNGDLDIERTSIVRPEKVYVEIDGGKYPLPTSLQNIIPSRAENIQIESDFSNSWDKTFQ